jgi:hypothetical protein
MRASERWSGVTPDRELTRSSRSYLALLIGIVLLAIVAICGVNVLVDPLWFFTHSHALNRAQLAFDERAQKSNWLAARPGQFDAVLFGSSRTTYIDQQAFAPFRMFNYAVNSMWPYEYRPYLENFTRVSGRSPELVVLGLDFFGSEILTREVGRPEDYLARIGDPRYVASHCSEPGRKLNR